MWSTTISGPEGNYLNEYGPYFTDFYRTPWGSALNFDGRQSDHVRHFFIQSALYWLENFHFDALRLDAVHSIYDASANPFLAEVSNTVARSLKAGWARDHADRRERPERCANGAADRARSRGLGMHGQWSDDFHHSLHTLITKENAGYYSDFGTIHHLAKTISNGWYYDGIYSPHRERRHGNSPLKTEARTICRLHSEPRSGRKSRTRRSHKPVDRFRRTEVGRPESRLSPFAPMLFMGEEYGETAPFQYFISHGDQAWWRRFEKAASRNFPISDGRAKIPDPQSEADVRTLASRSFARRTGAASNAWASLQSCWNIAGAEASAKFGRRRRRITRCTLRTACHRGQHIATLFHFGENRLIDVQATSRKLDKADRFRRSEWRGPSACRINSKAPMRYS